MYNVRKIEENINMRGDFQGFFLYDQELAPRTSFKVGGKAQLLVEPATKESFLMVLESLKKYGFPYLILGGCSNVVVPDEGIEYPILSTTQLKSISLSPDKTLLHCGAGCSWQQVIDFCLEQRLGGLENFAGLPGTLGGATFMNARCYDVSISDVLVQVEYGQLSVNEDEQWNASLKTYKMNAADWDYKVSPFQKELLQCPVLAVTLKVHPLDEAEFQQMKQKSQSFVADRQQKGHFSYPSAGSVFKNNRDFGKPSGKIVDEAGLRGLELGGAQVAPWHGNFIINRGNASAGDIQQLVQVVQEKVLDKTGFFLEPEIIFLSRSIKI
ncbi:MAG: UDP-N-acetylmuramate dehydrogenase [Spirochaetaceae bacterium]|nr:UDP-N-acetylmuramate dehydrogenase [Spirochaetaceae bacterium]